MMIVPPLVCAYRSVTGQGAFTATILWLSALFGPGLLWGLVHRLRFGDEPIYRTFIAGLLYPFFLVVGMVATWRALGRHLARRDGWAKTERQVELAGLSRA